MRSRVLSMSFAAGALLLGACAPSIPTERLQSSAAAIRAAQEVGAERVPRAALHLQLAKEQSEQAKEMIEDGDRQEASAVLLRAESDANLAVALARRAHEDHEAEVAAGKVRALQTQMK
jgi:hypothetical protein